jgi:hypothetical protein
MTDYSEDRSEVESRLTGDARAFMQAINTGWHIFHGIETMAPLATFSFGNGVTSASQDWGDVPRDLLLAKAKGDSNTTPDSNDVSAKVYGTDTEFQFEVAYELNRAGFLGE